MNLKHAIAAAAALSLGTAVADNVEGRTVGAWIAHADAVFATADAENLAFAAVIASRAAWVAHADAVFRAADEQNLALARALDGAEAGRVALRLVRTSVDR